MGNHREGGNLVASIAHFRQCASDRDFDIVWMSTDCKNPGRVDMPLNYNFIGKQDQDQRTLNEDAEELSK